ncbi:MAG: hypothetical protein PHT54_04485 [Candidatus Nanoarchaeia archaeon]|nr:hypothetical protein [Candidatus Nanoarchaeia archaeon]
MSLPQSDVNNNEKEQEKLSKHNYQEILDWAENRTFTIKEIIKNFGITKPTAKKYLDLLVEERALGYSNKLDQPTQDYKWVFRIAYKITKWGKQNMYYFPTPNASKLYGVLMDKIKENSRKETCKILINDICDTFRVIELMAIFEEKRLSNTRSIKAHFKNKGIELTSEQIEKKKEEFMQEIRSFSSTKVDITLPFKNDLRDVDGEMYLKIKDNLIKVEKLRKFLNLIRENMSDEMFFVAYKDPANRERIFKPMIDNMVKLFYELEGSSSSL